MKPKVSIQLYDCCNDRSVEQLSLYDWTRMQWMTTLVVPFHAHIKENKDGNNGDKVKESKKKKSK